MKEYILNMLKNGMEEDEILFKFEIALSEALQEHEKYLEEKAKKEEEARLAREAAEYKKKLQDEAIADLGTAYVNYLQAHGVNATEATLARLDEALSRHVGPIPGFKVIFRR